MQFYNGPVPLFTYLVIYVVIFIYSGARFPTIDYLVTLWYYTLSLFFLLQSIQILFYILRVIYCAFIVSFSYFPSLLLGQTPLHSRPPIVTFSEATQYMCFLSTELEPENTDNHMVLTHRNATKFAYFTHVDLKMPF